MSYTIWDEVQRMSDRCTRDLLLREDARVAEAFRQMGPQEVAEERMEEALTKIFEVDSLNGAVGAVGSEGPIGPPGPLGAQPDPPEWLPPYVRETPRIGRNQTCPCGCGKKFKHCGLPVGKSANGSLFQGNVRK
jgi:uncharacterized protein YecA (UPF0149 family)